MATVLLTGAGGAAIPDLIERLRKSGHRVLTADMDKYAVGLYMADSGFIIPAGTSPEFLVAIRHLCLREKVDVLVPLVDEELVSALELEKNGVVVLLPKRDFVETCLDKFILMQRLKSKGISSPETRLASKERGRMRFPLVVKPRTGRGSRGLGIVTSEEDLHSFLDTSSYALDELIVQEYIDGPEFTVSVIVWRDGEVQAVVPKEIIFKKGVTRLAVTRRHAGIEKLCRDIQKCLRADGPFNVQLRINKDTGNPFPFEINPRFSTTISLTIAAGADELVGLITQALEGRKGYKFGNWQEGMVLIRRTADQFLDEEAFRGLKVMKVSLG